MKSITFVIALLSISSNANAASFDCAKASTSIEKMICSDAKLSELDSQLMQTYKKALADSSNASGLKAEQKNWLTAVRNKCPNANCIEIAYSERIRSLSKSDNTTPTPIIAAALANKDNSQTNISSPQKTVSSITTSINSLPVIDEQNPTSFCARVQANDWYRKYATLTGDAVRGGYFTFLTQNVEGSFLNVRVGNRYEKILTFSPDGSMFGSKYERFQNGEDVVLPFDSKDRLLLKWMLKKQPDFLVIEQNYKYNYNIPNDVKTDVSQCFDKLLMSDFAYVFLDPDQVSLLREASTKAHANQQPQKPAKTVREISDSGEVVEKTVVDESTNKSSQLLLDYEAARNAALYRYPDENSCGDSQCSQINFPHWLALVYGGEKILNTTALDYANDYKVMLDKNKVTIPENNRQLAALQKAENAAEEKKAQEHSRLISMIKQGNYSQVKSCTDVSEALQPESYGGVLVTPPKKLYGGLGYLEQHINSPLGGAEELLSGGDGSLNFLKLLLTKNTIRIGMDKAKIKNVVMYVGRYDENTSIRLVTGAAVAAPVISAICVEY